MKNRKSVLSQRWSAQCLYLVGSDRLTSDSCWDRFQFTAARHETFSCAERLWMRWRSILAQTDAAQSENDDKRLHISINDNCHDFRKILAIWWRSPLRPSNQKYCCCQVTDPIRL